MINTVYKLTCDLCEKEETKTFNTLKDIVNYKKNNEWQCLVTTTKFVDICPECAIAQVERLLSIKHEEVIL